MSDDLGAVSLADLADLDVTEIAEIRFENLPPGVYGFKVLSGDLDEKENRDGDNRIIVVFKFEVIEVNTVLKKGVDKEGLIGKTHTEKLYIVPDQGEQKLLEGLGRVRAFLADMGAENQGKLGNILAAAVDHSFTAKIVERPNPSDRTSPFAQMKLESKRK